jgi:ectoine hydroxylase-related dioxygenase (phytanoyl-CoA dioxygenase family)
MNEEGDLLFPGAPQDDYSALPAHLRLPVEQVTRDGWTVLQGQLSPSSCAAMRDAVSTVYRAELEEFGGPSNMATIADEGVSRSPFLRDDRFVEPIRLPDVLAVARHFFGPVVQMNLQRVVINEPGSRRGTGIWHRDHSYQTFTTSRPVSLTALAMIDGSAKANGAPSVLTGSHRFENFPSFDYARERAAPLLCGIGDVVLIDSALFHRTEVNPGPHTRHTVVTIYTVPMIRQNVNYPRLLGGRWADDPVLGQLMGYSTALPESDLEYRQQKLRRGKRVARDAAVLAKGQT